MSCNNVSCSCEQFASFERYILTKIYCEINWWYWKTNFLCTAVSTMRYSINWENNKCLERNLLLNNVPNCFTWIFKSEIVDVMHILTQGLGGAKKLIETVRDTIFQLLLPIMSCTEEQTDSRNKHANVVFLGVFLVLLSNFFWDEGIDPEYQQLGYGVDGGEEGGKGILRLWC